MVPMVSQGLFVGGVALHSMLAPFAMAMFTHIALASAIWIPRGPLEMRRSLFFFALLYIPFGTEPELCLFGYIQNMPMTPGHALYMGLDKRIWGFRTSDF